MLSRLGEHHDQAVYAGRDSAMRRSSVFECVNKLAESLLDLLFVVAQNLEDALLESAVVYPDACRLPNSSPVSNEVVAVRQHFARVGLYVPLMIRALGR